MAPLHSCIWLGKVKQFVKQCTTSPCWSLGCACESHPSTCGDHMVIGSRGAVKLRSCPCCPYAQRGHPGDFSPQYRHGTRIGSHSSHSQCTPADCPQILCCHCFVGTGMKVWGHFEKHGAATDVCFGASSTYLNLKPAKQ